MNDFEHIPSSTDVRTYLQEYLASQNNSMSQEEIQLLCRFPEGCDIWRVEPFLLDRLKETQQEPEKHAQEIFDLRGLIRATSWMQTQPMSNEILLTIVDQTRITQEEKNQILKCLSTPLSGRDAGSSVLIIENAVQKIWKQLREAMAQHGLLWSDLAHHEKIKSQREELQRLHPLRDQLYFQYLYPMWFRAGKKC